MREERRSLFTRTESPGRAPEYCKEGKRLSSSLGWRLGPQLKLFGLLYSSSFPPPLSFLNASFQHRYARGEGEVGNREASFLFSAFSPLPCISFPLIRCHSDAPSLIPILPLLRALLTPPSRQGLMSSHLFPGKLQRACRLLGWNTLFYMRHKRQELCKQYYF